MRKTIESLMILVLAAVLFFPAACRSGTKTSGTKDQGTPVVQAAQEVPAPPDLARNLAPRQLLGKALFFDEDLSTPPGESCATCHDPRKGFEDDEDRADLNPFSATYDLYLAGTVKLTAEEALGLKLFEDEKKGNCSACHPSRPDADGTTPLFTDNTYDNLGTPKKPDNPFYHLLVQYNPDGENYIDKGLGGFLKIPAQVGRKSEALQESMRRFHIVTRAYLERRQGRPRWYCRPRIRGGTRAVRRFQTDAFQLIRKGNLKWPGF